VISSVLFRILGFTMRFAVVGFMNPLPRIGAEVRDGARLSVGLPARK
jgi:hypothetical protein